LILVCLSLLMIIKFENEETCFKTKHNHPPEPHQNRGKHKSPVKTNTTFSERLDIHRKNSQKKTLHLHPSFDNIWEQGISLHMYWEFLNSYNSSQPK
jgi:hypothetical protein